MATLSYGYAHGFPYFRPEPEPSPDLFIVNKGSIYSMLTPEKFSVYKALADKSVLYREMLNNMNLRLTALVFPDSELSKEVKDMLARLDRAEATTLMGYHVSERATKWLDGHIIKAKQGNTLIARVGNVVMLPGNESSQRIRLLSEGNYFKNGVVYVINQPIIQGA